MAFNWIKFDNSFLLEIIKASDLSDKVKEASKEALADKEYLVSKVNLITPIPNEKFILKYRTIIEQMVLKYYKTEVSKICRSLNIQATTHNARQVKMTQKPTSASLIRAYITALHNICGMDVELNEFSKFKSTIAVNMKETDIEDVPLYDFQDKVVSNLKKHFIINNEKAGIMVMPTGSGKSRTATHFLIKEMISQGYQIIWIAHRHMLIDQAAECFYNFASLAKVNNPSIKDYNISCVSGEHLSIKQVDKDQVIVASIASICRSKEHLLRILGRKVMIVVDECHHTLAPTYKTTIEYIQKHRSNTKLLGLTATPIRANDKDSKKLRNIFDDNMICIVPMADMIAKGYLAEPNFKQIETDESFEADITEDEKKLIRRYRELPESLIKKIAQSKQRNKIILNEYLNNKEKYGKTLIFALNVVHCRFLYEELKKQNVRVGLVYSGKEDNIRVINRFKENKLDVLVNVNIMTEGTDVPDIQTVFLTRPTESEGFLMQMIGRGMRGPQMKGTETVNIVDFHDKWETFNNWLNPKWTLLDEDIDNDKAHENVMVKRNYVEYEWKLCQEVYREARAIAHSNGYALAVPVGWFSLVNDDGELDRMLVFEDQLAGLKKLMIDKSKWSNDTQFTVEEAIDKYFGGFCYKPSKYQLQLLMDNIHNLDYTPHLYPLENRKSIDPCHVVQKAEKEKIDLFELASDIYDNNSVVRDLYQDKAAYTMELCKMKIYKEKSIVLGAKVEELPLELLPFEMKPYYDLEVLTQEVKNEMFGGEFDGISSITWTDKPYKSYYGVHYGIDHSIKINCVLNTKEVPKDVIKFVIYHELLHRDNMKHDQAFKLEEHKYPKFEDAEFYLYNTMKKFDITEM